MFRKIILYLNYTKLEGFISRYETPERYDCVIISKRNIYPCTTMSHSIPDTSIVSH